MNLLETLSDSYDDILMRLDTKSSFPIELGQLRMVMFGKQLAERGIDDIINDFSRNPVVGSRTNLGVAEHKAESILLSTKNVNIPFHLTNKISQNVHNGNLPKTNLHLFLSDYYSEGKDPYLPYFIHERDEVKIDGLGLFKKGKYVRYINLRHAFLLKLLVDGTKNGSYKIKIEDKGFVLLQNLDVKTTYSIQTLESTPNISIDFILNCQIKDAPPEIDLNETKNILFLEQTIRQHFKEEIEKLISMFQENKIDPIGIGQLIRAHSRNWDYENYLSLYPQLKFSVHPKIRIIQTGVGE